MVDATQDDVFRACGAAIRAARESAGLTQEETSFRAEIEQSTLSKIERLGPQVVSWKILSRLANVLGCHIDVRLTRQTNE